MLVLSSASHARPHPQGADLLGFLKQALCRADQPDPAPILDPEGNKYHAHWQQAVPLYHKTSFTVHAHPDLGVDGCLGAYECVGPGWQLNVVVTHIAFGEQTKEFLETLSLAYRCLSLLAPTIIVGDLNAAPTDDDCSGPPKATDIAVQDAMHQLGLTDLTARFTSTASHYPHQAGTHPSYIDRCYGDPTTVRVHEAAYGNLPPTGTGHRPLYIDLIIPNLAPPAATLPDDTLPLTLQFPAEDEHSAWHRYNRALHAIMRRPDAPTPTTAMRRAAQACIMERDTSHTGAPPDFTLQQIVHDIWTTKEEPATLLRPSTPEARDWDAHLLALLTTRSHQLQKWHAHHIAAAAQERERYGRNDTPYKSLWYVSRILEDTGRRTIHAVRTPEGGLTNDQRDCFVVQGKKQETNTGSKPKMPDHYRCTITCAFCGKRKHYEDECYDKQCPSARLKGEDPGKGSGKRVGKDKKASGKGKSKGRGKGQDKSQDGRGGVADRQQEKDNKNQDISGGNPNPNAEGNSEPSVGQSGSGPTTRSQIQGPKSKGPGQDMKVVAVAKLRREPASCGLRFEV